MSENFERIVYMVPAFDKRHTDPSKDYGIHGVELRMVLRGPLGATQFVLYTNWYLSHVTEDMIERTLSHPDRIGLKCRFLPLPADLGYHWRTPQYEGQCSCENCKEIGGGVCYYDGSSLNAERIYEVLLREGSDGVWRELEAFYNDLAGKQL